MIPSTRRVHILLVAISLFLILPVGIISADDTDGLDTEEHARAYANDRGMFYLSPYNDLEVIAGQGTCAVEIVDDLPDVDAVFVAVERFYEVELGDVHREPDGAHLIRHGPLDRGRKNHRHGK